MNKLKSKKEFVAKIAERTDMSKKAVQDVLEAQSELVVETLRNGGEVVIPGGVKLRIRDKAPTAARVTKNPKTGEEMHIPAKPATKAVKATIQNGLKESVLSD